MNSLSTYDFSTLYNTFPNNLIKEKLYLFERVFKIRGFFPISTGHRQYNVWSCQDVCGALSYLFDNIIFALG